MDETLPCLLNVSSLISPLASAINEIKKLQARARTGQKDEILLHGITVLSLAYYEVGLADSLRYYLRHFPYKLKDSEVKFAKDTFVEEQFDLMERAIDKFITTCAYKNFRDFHKCVTEITSIKPKCAERDLAKVQEFRARRNLLIHNALVVNDAYQESSGLSSPPSKGGKLAITPEYVDASFKALVRILKQIQIAIETTYRRYTRIKAAKELWSYLFKSPIMPFEDFWVVDDSTDRIAFSKESPREAALSGAEKRLLGLWRSHFNGQGDFLKDFNMRLFDRSNQMKVLRFLAWNREYLFG